MCDTMVALGKATRDGSVLFAKNSDRQPNEPQIIIRVPRKTHPEGSRVQCTYISIDQAPETYAVLLLKPSWIWGCEMGSNEYGLTIGNEAVFTREKYGPNSLIGMDMARIALERCQNSEAALHLLTGLLEQYGQGGNCGFEKKFTYHNSFLLADKTSAWVLETAGSYWAAERVKDLRSISNCLTIGNRFDLSHPELVKHAVHRGWCRGAKDFHFARCYSDPLMTRLSGAKQRLATSTAMLQQAKGSITVATMKSILRSHEDRLAGNPFTSSSLHSICMHGGFLYGDHTTGSFIASLNANTCTYWLTGSSTPCVSTFKPFWLLAGENFTFGEEEEERAVAYWKKRERFFRMVLENRIVDLDGYLQERDALERELQAKVTAVELKGCKRGDLLAIMGYAMEREEELLERTMENNKNNPAAMKGNPYFRYYWKRQNQRLGQA